MEQREKGDSLAQFLIAAFAFSWLFWLAGVLASQGLFTLPVPNTVLVITGAHGPLVAALALTYRRGGWAAVKDLLRDGFRMRIKLVWWLVILLLPFVLSGLAVWLNRVNNGFLPEMPLLNQPVMILPTFLIMFFFGGSFQEEFGWRGFALPLLLKRWSPLLASIILGVIWGAWHLPLFYIAGTSQVYMPFSVFLVLALGLSVMFTWFYLRTGGNLFTALLFHTAVNTSFSVFPPIEPVDGGNQTAFLYLSFAFSITALAVIWMNRRTWLKEV